jgi:glutamate/tyrosine decarboxylase-like PLP-dependent enzyme
MLARTFAVSTGYMPSQHAEDPYTTSMQWSRRFLGLRLFLSLATAGWSGHGAHVDRTLALAAQFRAEVAINGWRVVNQSALGVVCVEPPEGTDVATIVQRVLASGTAWVARAMYEGRATIRVCVTSGETSADDVSALVKYLHQAAVKGIAL